VRSTEAKRTPQHADPANGARLRKAPKSLRGHAQQKQKNLQGICLFVRSSKKCRQSRMPISTFSVMKKMLLTIAMLLTLSMAMAQLPFQLEWMLEEKVRDQPLRHMLEQLAAYPNDAVLQQQISDYVRNRDNATATNRAEEAFTGGAEPYITMNPNDPNHIVVSYMEEGNAFEYPVYVSTDGGSSWTRSSFSTAGTLATEFPGHIVLGGGDPVFAFSDSDTLHMTWIYLHGQGFNFRAGMFYAYSVDGGVNFTVPAPDDHAVHDGTLFPTDMLDRQWMDMDNTGGVYDGNLYMSGIYFGGVLGNAGEVIVVKPADSTGFNDTVNVAVPLASGEAAQFGNVKVGPNGDVHMSCMKFDQSSGAGGVYYVRSSDGAQTFTTPVMIGTGTTALPNGGNHPVHDRDNSATSMALDGNNIYIAWSDFAASRVKGFLVRSNDGGLTWSAPYEFGADLLDTNYHHLMPNVAAHGGKVSVAWYAVRTSDMITHYYMAESNNAGATFGNVANISTATTDFANEGSGFYGDYNTSVRNGCDVYAAWADGRIGNPVLYVSRVDACNLQVQQISPLHDAFSVGALYPNPATGDAVQVTLTDDSGAPIAVSAWSLDGKKVADLGTVQGGAHAVVQVSIGKLAAGAYLIRFERADGVFATRYLVHE
jgi:hypothetical protein